MDYSQPWFIIVWRRAIVKYGFNNFTIIILSYTDDNNLINLKQEYIDKHSPKYNTLKYEYSSKGHKHSKKVKTKMRL